MGGHFFHATYYCILSDKLNIPSGVSTRTAEYSSAGVAAILIDSISANDPKG